MGRNVILEGYNIAADRKEKNIKKIAMGDMGCTIFSFKDWKEFFFIKENPKFHQNWVVNGVAKDAENIFLKPHQKNQC